jgi:uncharacterized protein YacL (UPF0231 family)
MGEEIKDVNAKIDAAEAAVKKYASKDTVISIGGYEFTPAKLMVAATLVSSILGGLYGAFEVYKDYQSMKKRIAEYVAPDLSELIAKVDLVVEKSEKAVQYTQDIKNDLKSDLRRVENVVDNIERTGKQAQRETDLSVKEIQTELRQTRKEVTTELNQTKRELSTDMNQARKELELGLKEVNANLDKKIQRALDNPLANK